MADVNAIVAQLTKPKPLGTVPAVDDGVFALFKDASWQSARYDVRLSEWSQGTKQLWRSDFWDTATWVAWRLPVGTVVTIADFRPPQDNNKGVGDLGQLGRSVELVGTGNTESTDLRDVDMNDVAASFVWRHVDLKYGAVEMFADPNFTGVRQTLFLSEWSPDTYHDIVDWHMNDRMSSARWKTLNNKQKVTLYADPQGRGSQYNQITGWGSRKEVNFFGDFGFNDTISCFSWTPLLPKKEIIEPITLKAQGSGMQQIAGAITKTNDTDSVQTFTMHFQETLSESVTVTTTETHVGTVQATFSVKQTAKISDIASVEMTGSLQLTYQYTHTVTDTTTTTTALTVDLTDNTSVPPRTTTQAVLMGSIGQINPGQYQTTATRWYDEAVAGGQWDPSNQMFKLTETIYVTLSGGLAGNFTIKTTQL